jgi:hypothetical protein
MEQNFLTWEINFNNEFTQGNLYVLIFLSEVVYYALYST